MGHSNPQSMLDRLTFEPLGKQIELFIAFYIQIISGIHEFCFSGYVILWLVIKYFEAGNKKITACKKQGKVRRWIKVLA